MNEMDIFVELIDDKEADRILKYFGETPLGTRQNKAQNSSGSIRVIKNR